MWVQHHCRKWPCSKGLAQSLRPTILVNSQTRRLQTLQIIPLSERKGALESPFDSNLPALVPVTAPLTEDQKEARQRLHSRRTYHRKLILLRSLRDQVKMLEAEYQEQVAKQRTMGARFALGPTDGCIPPQTRVNNYTYITEVKEELRQHNEVMHAALVKYQRLGHTLLSMQATDGHNERTSYQQPRRHLSLTTPISAERCDEIWHRSLSEISHFRGNLHFLSTGVSAFGWCDRRIRDGNHLKFIFQKEFQGIKALDIMERVWDVVSSPKLASIYSTGMNPQVIFLAARRELSWSHTIIMRSLDQDLFDAPQDD